MSNAVQGSMGSVVSLWRYPVKSMMGEELNAADVTERGLLGDRAYALVDTSDGKAATGKNPRKWPHLFEQLGKGQVRYCGCFSCSSWEHRETKDKEGHSRSAIVFHLAPIESVSEPSIAPEPSAATTLAELRQRALEGGREAGEGSVKDAKRRAYERSKDVRDYVLARANGTCEACGRAAPFTRLNGSPYLEPHHTRRLSDGGPDHPRWVGGICPNCHREIHHGVNGVTINRALEDRLGAIEEAAR